ncbi:MAG: hypothetical protein AAF702_51000 [Chloroflexota bacterium]
MFYRRVFQREETMANGLRSALVVIPNACWAGLITVCILLLAADGLYAASTKQTTPIVPVLILSNSVEPEPGDEKFNLLINGSVIARDVESGYSTEPLMIAVGDYEISVEEGTENSLALYETTIICINHNNTILVNQVATTVNLEIEEGSRIECAIYHRRLPVLNATLTDELFRDADESGGTTPGDTLLLQIEVSNLRTTPATGVVLTVPIDDYTTLIPGTVTTSEGTINQGYRANDSSVVVTIGNLTSTESVRVSFQVQINNPLPNSVQSVTFQGIVSSNETNDILTDDPYIPGESQPTEVSVTASPLLKLSHECVRLIDADSDMAISAGDTIFCKVLMQNIGNGDAINIELGGEIDTVNTELIPNTLETNVENSINTNDVESGTQVSLTVDSLASGDEVVSLSYILKINSNITENSIPNQFAVTTPDPNGQTDIVLAQVTSFIPVAVPVNEYLYLPLVNHSNLVQ